MQQSDQLNDGVVGLITPVRGGPDQLDVPTVLGTGWYNVPGDDAEMLSPGGAMLADTGFPRADAENEFLRARRRQVLARLAHRLRREPRDINRILPLDEVLGALGKRGERHLGLQTIRLDTIIGTADSRHDLTAASGPPPAGAVPLGAPGAGAAPR